MKFLVKPITGGTDASAAAEQSGRKTALAMLLGCGIGWVCGFTGSGGGILMLTVFTLVLGYNLNLYRPMPGKPLECVKALRSTSGCPLTGRSTNGI